MKDILIHTIYIPTMDCQCFFSGPNMAYLILATFCIVRIHDQQKLTNPFCQSLISSSSRMVELQISVLSRPIMRVERAVGDLRRDHGRKYLYRIFRDGVAHVTQFMTRLTIYIQSTHM